MEPTPAVPLSVVLVPPGREVRRQLWRRRLLGVAIVAFLIVLPSAWLVLARGTTPADGVFTYPSDPRWSAVGGVGVMEVLQTGSATENRCALRSGEPAGGTERVVAVDGVPLDDWVRGGVDRTRPRVGEVLQYRVVSADGDSPCTVDVRLGRFPWGALVRAHAEVFVLAGVMWAIATFVILNRPGDRAARAIFAVAVVLPYGATAWPAPTQVVDLLLGPRLWPFLWGDVANALVWGGVLHFCAVFPRAVRPLRRRRWAVATLYAIPFALYLVEVARHGWWSRLPALVVPNSPQPELGPLATLLPVSVPAATVVPFLAALIMIWQYRSAGDDDRRRMRWVIYSFLLAAGVYVFLGQLPAQLLGRELVPWPVQVLSLTTVPVALAAAVMRYGILDLQVILRRSLVYGSLTVALVVVPALVTWVVTERVVAPAVGARPTPWDLLLIVALVGSVLLQTLRGPLKRRLSTFAFGARDDPFELVSQLSARLHAVEPAESVLPSVAETVARALRLPHVGIEVVSPDGIVDTESYGQPQGKVLVLPLVDQGEEVGTLRLDVGTRREPFGPADQRLIELLTQQVGLAARSVLLTARLQRSLQRAVVAREEERRRLRRDIHDGVGPMLAASKLQLELARRTLTTKPDAVGPILEDLVNIHRTVIGDMRRLVEGLRPPVLDQLGLTGAVRAHAETLSSYRGDGTGGEGSDEGHGADGADGVTFTVEASGIEPLPAAVEVAAYRILLEAMTNVARHSGASQCRVRLWRPTHEALLLEVEDDGQGLPERYRPGVGLNSMRERTAELGGAFSIIAGAPKGTVLRARLPMPAPAADGAAEEVTGRGSHDAPTTP